MMSKRILFFDNDTGCLPPYREALEDEGYEVRVAGSLTEAEQALSAERFDLLVLDVMIPPMSDEEVRRYKPEDTAFGYKTGLRFYTLNKEKFKEAGVRVLVMTVRLDKPIMDEFIRAGLPPIAYATKYDMSDPEEFVGRVRALIEEPTQ